MPRSRQTPKKPFPLLPLALLLVLSWCGLWGTSAFMVRRAVDDWAISTQSKPLRIEAQDPHLSGFPFEVVWKFAEVKGSTESGPAFSATDVSLHAMPWNWKRFRFRAEKTMAKDVPLPTKGNVLSFRSESTDGRIQETGENEFNLTSLELLDASVLAQDKKLFTADELEFVLVQPAQAAASYKETGATLALKGRGILLADKEKNPLGNKITLANALIRILGALPNFSNKNEVKEWNDASGVFECDSVNLIWGPLSVEMKGTLALTPTLLQPEGAFSGHVTGLKEVLNALTATGALEKRQAATLKATLPHFAKSVEGSKTGEVEIPLSVQQGGLYVGPVKILDLPPLAWE